MNGQEKDALMIRSSIIGCEALVAEAGAAFRFPLVKDTNGQTFFIRSFRKPPRGNAIIGSEQLKAEIDCGRFIAISPVEYREDDPMGVFLFSAKFCWAWQMTKTHGQVLSTITPGDVSSASFYRLFRPREYVSFSRDLFNGMLDVVLRQLREPGKNVEVLKSITTQAAYLASETDLRKLFFTQASLFYSNDTDRFNNIIKLASLRLSVEEDNVKREWFKFNEEAFLTSRFFRWNDKAYRPI